MHTNNNVKNHFRFIVELPETADADKCLHNPGPMSKPDQGRFVVDELTFPERSEIYRSGGRFYANREMSIPKGETSVEPINDNSDDISAQVTNSTRAHGADALHARGIRGQGVDIVVIDTGIAPHPDLANKIDAFYDVFANGETAPNDGQTGHGTHVSGIAAADGQIEGIAPDSRLLGIKVLDNDGRGSTASVLNGMDKAIEYFQQRGRPMVVNMSLGGRAGPVANDPLVAKVKEMREAGIQVVVAAGNEGPNPGTIGSPGTAPDAISVAAFDTKGTATQDDDTVTSFSSRGSSDANRGQVGKPDVGANGFRVTSTYLDGQYAALSGTSMAAPAVAGAAALLLSQAQALWIDGKISKSPLQLVQDDDIRQALESTATDKPDIPETAEGAGNIRVDRAEAWLVQQYGTDPSDPVEPPPPPPPSDDKKSEAAASNPTVFGTRQSTLNFMTQALSSPR